MTKYSTKVVV